MITAVYASKKSDMKMDHSKHFEMFRRTSLIHNIIIFEGVDFESELRFEVICDFNKARKA